MVGGVLSVTVKLAVQVDSLFAASMTCKVTVVTPRPTIVPAAGVWMICTGAEPLQSLATRPLLVKSEIGRASCREGREIWLVAGVLIVGGVWSVTVEGVVQVDCWFVP